MIKGKCGPGSGFLQWIVPENIAGIVVTSACSEHDKCYAGKGKYANFSKGKCDEKFYLDLLRIRNQAVEDDLLNPNSWQDIKFSLGAWIYFRVVVRFGGRAWKNARSR